MNVVPAIEEGSISYQDLDFELELSFKYTVRNFCGLFVTVVNLKIYLIHQTAKEYLILNKDSAQPVSHFDSCLDIWKHSLEPGESNLVAKICISYLLFTVLGGPPLVTNREVGLREIVEEYNRRHGFLGYAAKYWAGRFREAKIKETALLKSAPDICNTQSKRFMTRL